jgi:hypothetical protein
MKCPNVRFHVWLILPLLLLLLHLPVETSAKAQQSNAESASTSVPASGLEAKFLPHDSGQKWAEYDIRSFTARWPESDHPERWITDWILRETGTDVWFGEPLGLLSASRDVIRVYHTPSVHQQVRGVIDRFMDPVAQQYGLSVRIITVGSPSWRSKAWPLMRSYSVASTGVDAWLLSKENAALLLADLAKRADYTEYGMPNLTVPHGQTHTVERRQARRFPRGIRWRDQGVPPYELETGVIDEGFSLQISPLVSVNATSVDAAIRCHIDQVERFLPVAIDLPVGYGPTQRVHIEVPQLVSWRLHERFRWPTDQVLLLSCGVVAAPNPERNTGLAWTLNPSRGRADALLVLECKRIVDESIGPDAARGLRSADSNVSRGRY